MTTEKRAKDEQKQLREFEENTLSLKDVEIAKKIQLWLRRIEQFESLGDLKNAKRRFKEFLIMIEVVKQRQAAPKSKQILEKDFQKTILDDVNLDEKLAKYYEKFGDGIVEESEEFNEVPSENEKDKIREEGFSLAVLKQLAGSNPVSEKDITKGFAKVKKLVRKS